MMREKVTIINKLGLHARASAKLVNTACQFQAEIWVRKEQQEISAKSIMALLLLAASKGTELEIITEGSDEEAALTAVKALIDSRFDESE